MKKKKKLSLLQKRALTGFAFITPWLIGFLWFYVKSLIQAVRFSLSKMEMLESGGYTLKFTGLDNFKYALFQDPTYNQILATSIRDIVIDVPLIIFFSLFIAMICNGKFKGRTLVRAILFLPIIMNAGAINNAIEMAREAVTGGVAAVSAEAAVASGVNVDYFMNLLWISDFRLHCSIISQRQSDGSLTLCRHPACRSLSLSQHCSPCRERCMRWQRSKARQGMRHSGK